MFIDFGVTHEDNAGVATKKLETQGITAIGTNAWMARELLVSPFGSREKYYTKPSDIWSFGMAIYVSNLISLLTYGLTSEIPCRKSSQSLIHTPPSCLVSPIRERGTPHVQQSYGWQ